MLKDIISVYKKMLNKWSNSFNDDFLIKLPEGEEIPYKVFKKRMKSIETKCIVMKLYDNV